MKNLTFRPFTQLTAALSVAAVMFVAAAPSAHAAPLVIPIDLIDPGMTTFTLPLDLTLPAGTTYSENLSFTLVGASASATPTVTTTLEGASPVTFTLTPATPTLETAPFFAFSTGTAAGPISGSFDDLVVTLSGPFSGLDLFVAGEFEVIPEPSIAAMLLCGLGALAFVIRRRSLAQP